MTVNRRNTIVLIIVAVILIAVLAITQWQRSVATKNLLAELPGTDYSKVLDATTQLKDRGSHIVPQLVELLRNSQPAARWRAAGLLGDVGTRAAWAPLQAALKDQSSPEVRTAAAQALGKLKAVDAVADIGARVTDDKEDLGVRVAAAMALGLMGDKKGTRPLMTALADRAEGLAAAKAAEEKVAQDKADAEQAKKEADAAKAAGLPAPKAKVRPAPAVPPPTDTRWELRKAAATSLGMLSDEAALQTLRDSADAIKEAHPEVRTFAAYALGDLAHHVQGEAGSRELIGALLLAQKDKVGDVRAAALHSLAFVSVPEYSQSQVAGVLRTALGQDDFYWAREAARSTMKALSISETG
jgi:HEAT repeat protein